ncbi:hypothetical protein ACP8Y2_13425 [Herpetosiphon llansteffanensis]
MTEQERPFTPEVVAAERAAFDRKNEQITATHERLEKIVAPVLNHIAEEAAEAAKNPAHQAFMAEQATHRDDQPNTTAGKDLPSIVPPHLAGSASPQPINRHDLNDDNAPQVKPQGSSLRSDS